MSELRHRAYASVEIVLTVETDTWGDECTMGQIVRQAKDSAIAKVRYAFKCENKDPEDNEIQLTEIRAVKIRCEEVK